MSKDDKFAIGLFIGIMVYLIGLVIMGVVLNLTGVIK